MSELPTKNATERTVPMSEQKQNAPAIGGEGEDTPNLNAVVRHFQNEAAEKRAEEERDKKSVAVQRVVDAAKEIDRRTRRPGESYHDHFERLAGYFYEETGMLPPGKDQALPMPTRVDRHFRWKKWECEPYMRLSDALSGLPNDGKWGE